MKKLFIQLFKFGIVGVVAAIVDVGLLTLLAEKFGVDVLISAAISFSVSVIVNYICSMKFVFQGKKQNKWKEFIIFLVLSMEGCC